MQKNVVFFKTVSQAVHDEPHDGTRTMRIGGGVLPGERSSRRADGADFDLTEGGVTVHVAPPGDEPDAVQGLRAGRRRRPLERSRLDHVRLDAAR